ncbi:MAG TPA: cytochrome C biogenesis protein [Spirochaetaceae bacterium]|nr:cytochrome C biogenesis protein [Spirochaetaceae bacterium]
MSQLSVLVAFGAGLLSFLSPCVLPLIPGYLSFISGKSAIELREGSDRAGVFLRTLFFVLGFSAVFVALGLIFSGGGMLFAGQATRWVSLAAGSIITIFGLNMIFDFIKVLNREARTHLSSKPAGAAGSFVVGMAFGAGWTPCIGPILASILIVAARSGRAAEAVFLLSSYSLGLALPFLLVGLFFERLTPLMTWFKKRGRELRIASGLLLVVLGMAMAFGRLTALNGLFARWGMRLASFASVNPAGAMAAGTVLWLLAGSSVAIIALWRRKAVTRWWRMALIAAALAMAALELLGISATVASIASWLLFQGV